MHCPGVLLTTAAATKRGPRAPGRAGSAVLITGFVSQCELGCVQGAGGDYVRLRLLITQRNAFARVYRFISDTELPDTALSAFARNGVCQEAAGRGRHVWVCLPTLGT